MRIFKIKSYFIIYTSSFIGPERVNNTFIYLFQFYFCSYNLLNKQKNDLHNILKYLSVILTAYSHEYLKYY